MINPARFIHYKVGHDDHDDQHWELLQQMDELVAVIKSGGDISPVLDKMLVDLNEHFVDEYNHMAESNYPYIQAHDEHHQLLVRQLKKMLVDAQDKNAVRSTFAIKQLETLFIDHIDQHDVQCAEYLKKHGH